MPNAPAVPAIPFNVPAVGHEELLNIQASLESRRISGDGPFTQKCHEALEAIYGPTVLLVHSCTAALEMAVLLIDLRPGDEVIMPSYTFVSTANAVALRGATPVFVDIRLDTLNIDEQKIEQAITPRTRAIMPVHYAGVGAEMSAINAIAGKHGLHVIEDAAQGFSATYAGRPLGTLGDIGCLSFHDTKNVVSGEGGALIVKNPDLARRALHIREKGTNRTEFLRREVTKYEWIDIGSSYLPSDLIAAVLLAQLQRADEITVRRRAIWKRYHEALAPLGNLGIVLPHVPANVVSNAHIFHLLTPDRASQIKLTSRLRESGVQASTHYVPLHDAPAGRKFARTCGPLVNTERAGNTLLRLPMFPGLTDEQVDYIIETTLTNARSVLSV